MIKDPEVPSRILAIIGNNGGWDNAPLVVLTVVCIVFCLIWTPMIFRCRCPHVRWLYMAGDAEIDRESAAFRATLENLRRLAFESGIAHQGSLVTRRSNPLHHLSPDERKDFLNNILVSRVRHTQQLCRRGTQSSNFVLWLKNCLLRLVLLFIENH